MIILKILFDFIFKIDSITEDISIERSSWFNVDLTKCDNAIYFSIRYNYYRLKSDTREYLIENFDKEEYFIVHKDGKDGTTSFAGTAVKFKNAEDAMAFKLRWI